MGRGRGFLPIGRRSSLLLAGNLGRVPRRGSDTQDAQVKGQTSPIDERERERKKERKEDDRPDEGLEGSTLGVDAQRDSFALLVLSDEAVDQLWSRGRK